ncbi:MAG: hypothetical protein GXO02_04855 [Epsilonproteobacteria bacterium]|nr:hypothetical protein [Campylobacterota bacterium]
MDEIISEVIIAQKEDFEEVIEELNSKKRENERFEIYNRFDENFKVEELNEIFHKAYLTSSERVIFIIASKLFSAVVQNKMLKILEEPPSNKVFILVTSSKSSILPTIRSRLPIRNYKKRDSLKLESSIEADLDNLTLKDIFEIVKRRDRITKEDIIPFLEDSLIKLAQKGRVDSSILDFFQKSREALEYGATPKFILESLLIKLLSKELKGR